MRLSQIKIVGFKSFVEPTKLQLGHALTAIVGPNGCGKSNSLDAVRWVMGESSARELRGGEMNDVLFSGSDQRAPVSQCSVELFFERDSAQTSGSNEPLLAGPFGHLNEIAVKRVHHREEGTRYYLNNQPCRRRDVLDLFNGTGLGPRSYALIGQGSISRIIEAKPDDLRHYIEEVAGIAGYRQRRKETLARLNKAQENLNQLSLLQDELEQQHQHLAKQAEQAQVFQSLQAEIKRLTWQVYQAKWYQTLNKLADLGDDLRRYQADFSSAKQAWDNVQIIWVSAKQARQTNMQAWQSQTQAYHQLDKAVSRLQQQHEFSNQQSQQHQQLLQHLQDQQQQATDALSALTQNRLELTAQASDLTLEIDSQQDLLAELADQLEELASQDAHVLLEKNQADKHLQQLQRQTTEMEWRKQALGRQLAQAEQQQAWLVDNPLNPQEDETANVDEALATLTERIRVGEEQLASLSKGVQSSLVAQKNAQQTLKEAQQAWQTMQAQHDALTRLQQSWQDKAQAQITEQALEGGYQWLLNELDVDPAWQQAVTAWLGPRIHGWLLSTNPVALLTDVTSVPKSIPFMLWPNATLDNPVAGSLAEVIQAPKALRSLANTIQRRDLSLSLIEQLSLLAPGQAIIDQQGHLYYPQAWQAAYEGEGAIYLARADEIAELAGQLPVLEAAYNQAQAQLQLLDAELAEQQQAWQAMQAQLPVWQDQYQTLEQQHIKAQQRQQSLLQQQQRLELQRQQSSEQLAALQYEFDQLDVQLEADYELLDQAQADFDQQQVLCQQLEQTQTPLLQQQQRLEMQLKQLLAEQTSVEQQLAQLNKQETQAQQQLEQARAGLAQLDVTVLPTEVLPPEELLAQEQQLVDMAESLAALEQALAQSEAEVEAAEQTAQTTQQAYQSCQHQLDTTQQALANQQQQLQLLSDQIQQEGLALPSMTQSAAMANVSLTQIETQLRDAKKRLQSMGNVNMTAIDERDDVAARLDELNTNVTDISESIDELEKVIDQLDRQGREQLLSCFNEVNEGFSALFPQLFKGGKASLSWLNSSEDPLEDGLTVMAQPPGKRNSRIQLLSGGEKTLTALALIFAIFQLRPAPFCILDEVDAPLDDSNVIRFCGLVSSLSEKVQFIIITHNKTTMAMAHQLLGVSMNEPGVSRLVSVDLAKAVEMIGEEDA